MRRPAWLRRLRWLLSGDGRVWGVRTLHMTGDPLDPGPY